jgi:hypothetical protein
LVEITHATPEGALSFALPDLRMDVRVADQLLPLLLDEIAVFTEPRRVSLAYRAAFEYAGAVPCVELATGQ